MTEIIFSPAPRPARREKAPKPAKMRKPIPKVSAKVLAANGGKPPRKVRARVKRRNVKRAATAYAHAYGSKARVTWIKHQPCVYCVALLPILAACDDRPRCENAHTGKKPGKGLKSHFTTIVPLCPTHHRRYDRYLAPFDDPKIRAALEAKALIVAARWDALGSARGDEGER